MSIKNVSRYLVYALVAVALSAAMYFFLRMSQAQNTTALLQQSGSPHAVETAPGAWKAFEKPSDSALRERLSSIQYNVTQHDGTETPFNNAYWNNEVEGIYVDIVSGEPLFSSNDKYDSGTGWPSFTKALMSQNLVEKIDYVLIVPRTEVRSKRADSHLGHVFSDGPQPTGLRYCMNSAAMRFIQKDKLAAEGYAEFLPIFQMH